MKKINLFYVVFILSLILTAVIRLYSLSNIPPALNWDEVSLGYNAFSILETGKDEWGNTLPLSFKGYGDYKLPGYVYLDVPFIAIFGLNEWGVRLPSAILGIGFIILISLILKELTNIHVRSWAIFLGAISPWTIIISRIALEAHLALFLTTLGFYFFLMGLKNPTFLLYSGFSFGMTIFSYNSSRVVTPLLIIALGLLFLKELKSFKRMVFSSLIIFSLFFAIALPKALLQDSSARYKWTSILDEGAINRINELRGSSALPPSLAMVTYNKVTYVVPEVLKNYVLHLDPRFLFLTGGSNYQFSVPGSGMFYPILAPFFVYGFWVIFKERKKWQFFMVVWLLISVIPAAITRDSPHALRSLMMILPVVVISSIGLDKFVGLFKNKGAFVKLPLIFVLLVNLYFFWNNYSGEYAKNYSWSWQYGYKEVVNYIKENGGQYEKIYVTKKYGEPHEFLLFYMGWKPQQYRNDPNLSRYFRSDWYWVDSFDKYVFVNDWEVVGKVDRIQGTGDSLLITSPGNYPDDVKFLKTINFLDGKPAFDIVEI
ncbi:hypothetical protein A2769_00945 [Candidatus Daviesbacteria bacterium RIFCSPHIGHO2_01_FULL_37_27]|nr:MAG: hypothetical protein A2769_00945 [Candidatus Daviesbacteria bacterium RIFCSPHIGHO2_01_FULL_37_27]